MGDWRTVVSYSQFSMWKQCPRQWQLAYALQLRSKEPNIDFVFGNALHKTLQSFLVGIYRDKNDTLDIVNHFFVNFHNEYATTLNKTKIEFSSPEELMAYFMGGASALLYIKNNWKQYYNVSPDDIISVEYPIRMQVHPTKPIDLWAALDVVIQSNRIKIQDIKTSKDGWNRFQTVDPVKISQVILYRHFYNLLTGVDKNLIDMEYLIIKRIPTTPNPIQVLPIDSDPILEQNIVAEFGRFLDECFTDDGTPVKHTRLEAISGKNGFNCNICEFKDNNDLCPIVNRK